MFRVILFIIAVSNTFAQQRVPPPPCEGNYNEGGGGSIGISYFTQNDTGTELQMRFNHIDSSQPAGYDDIFVIYIATGVAGRNVLDETVDDSADPYRIAISNSNAFGFGSTITFPPGFEAAYAVAVDINSGGLYAIPDTGTVGDNGLVYINSVNSTLTSVSQDYYEIELNYDDLGISSETEITFIGLRVGHDGYTYDEGYGDGLTAGTQGADDVTFTLARTFEDDSIGCVVANLSDDEFDEHIFEARYLGGELIIDGLNDKARIGVYDLLGRELLNREYQINDNWKIPIPLSTSELQFIIIECKGKRAVLKVVPK